MLRPKSAMFYIDDIEQISAELNDLINSTIDKKGEVDDLLDIVNRWSLESIIAIFLDMRIHCLDKDLPSDSDAQEFVKEALAKSESFKDKSDDELSVLQKLIKKCGKN